MFVLVKNHVRRKFIFFIAQVIEEKTQQCKEMNESMRKEKQSHVRELDRLLTSKNEELYNTHTALSEVSQRKAEMEELVNLKQGNKTREISILRNTGMGPFLCNKRNKCDLCYSQS